MPPRKPNPDTTEIHRKDLTTDDIADTAPLAPKLPDDARILLMESRTALTVILNRLRIAADGDIGKLRDKIAKYLLEVGQS